KAVTDFKSGLDINKSEIRLYASMIRNYILQGRTLFDRGQSPLRMLKKARELVAKAAAVNPEFWEIPLLEAQCALLNARWKTKKGQSPESLFKSAGESLTLAAKLNPGDITLHLTRAFSYMRKAEWNKKRPLIVLENIAEGLEAVKKALRINSNCPEAYALKGVLIQLRAKVGAAEEESSRVDLEEAAMYLQRAIKINGNLKKHYSCYLNSNLKEKKDK
ncbi:MAG: hypothetical protein GY757_39240, partial [bacterium]|nr:hypothetical protein [bacterium]